MGDATDFRDRMGTGELARPLDWPNTVGQHLTGMSHLWLSTAAALFVVATSGIGVVPNLHRWVAAAVAPNTLDDAGVILSSPAGPALARLIGADSPGMFAALHALLLAAAIGGVYLVAIRRFGPVTSRTVILLTACLPVTAIMSSWLGAPDPFIFAAGAGLALTRDVRWGVLWGLVGGFASFEQAAVIVVCLAIYSPDRRVPLIGAAAGALAGKVGVVAYNHLSGIDPQGSRLGWMLDHGVGYFARIVLENWHTLTFSLFAGAWVLVWWLGRRAGPRFAAALTFAGLVMLVTADSTRVFGLLTFPVLLAAVADHRDDLEQHGHKLLGMLTVATVVLPTVIVWEGNVYGAIWGGL